MLFVKGVMSDLSHLQMALTQWYEIRGLPTLKVIHLNKWFNCHLGILNVIDDFISALVIQTCDINFCVEPSPPHCRMQ